MPFMTIFTAPKPFTNPHIATIQRNAILSWVNLGADVEVLMIGDEEGMAEAAKETGATHIAKVACNRHGTPLVRSLFDIAREEGSSPVLAFVNADVMLLPDIVETSKAIHEQAEDYLIIGQRWDLAVKEQLDFSSGWEDRLRVRCQKEGRLHPRGGSDYFIFPKTGFVKVPEIVIGRAGWDNWMIYEARRKGWPTIDATESIQIIHQDHDYSHLPGGQPHYRLPETAENVRLAGGNRAIFTLLDTDKRFVDGKIEAAVMNWEKFWREVEIFPLITLRCRLLGHLFFAVFHPKRAYKELRKYVAQLRERKTAE